MRETRTVLEVKVWKLILNPMRSNTENGVLLAFSDDKEKILNWYNSQLEPEPYKEEGSPSFGVHGSTHTWVKQFKKGSNLEWYNPMNNDGSVNMYGQGLVPEWVEDSNLHLIPYLRI